MRASCVPSAEQSLARNCNPGIIDRQIARRLFEHNFPHIRKVSSDPPIPRQKDFRAAVLRLSDGFRAGTKAATAEGPRRIP